ncbi:MAG: hypothetical protein Sw2LagPseu_33470 [Shewanella algae]
MRPYPGYPTVDDESSTDNDAWAEEYSKGLEGYLYGPLLDLTYLFEPEVYVMRDGANLNTKVEIKNQILSVFLKKY